ncbi:MAG: hypothetical protein OXR73_00295 [Myxococcales bacterium]|nr:hypothetical protein [Myxococcales bacterium]
MRYWRGRNIEDRVSAVETIREATLGIYTDEAANRLERVRPKDLADIALLDESTGSMWVGRRKAV